MDDKLYICLVGPHRSGKSTIGKALMGKLGFVRAHPFNPGRAACLGWLAAHGVVGDEADEMTDGRLKDTGMDFLPVTRDGRKSSFRALMDVVGVFTGVNLGPRWTIDADVAMRDLISRSEKVDVSGMSDVQAMSAATVMFMGASGADARNAVMNGSPIVDHLLPEWGEGGGVGGAMTVTRLTGAYDRMFDIYEGMSAWRGGVAAEGCVIEPLRLVPPAVPDSPGYVLESCIHEIEHIRESRPNTVVIRVVPDRVLHVEDAYAAAKVDSIIEDLVFVNPMISEADTWEKFCRFMEDNKIADPEVVTGPEPV